MSAKKIAHTGSCTDQRCRGGCQDPDGKSELAVRTGSLPALSVELLAVTWDKEAEEAWALSAKISDEYSRGWNDGMARAFTMAAEQIRAEMERANVRQPEENMKVSERLPATDAASTEGERR